MYKNKLMVLFLFG